MEVIEQLIEQAVQKTLATAALKKPIKRKAAGRYSDDASILASHPGNAAGKRRIFSMPEHDPTPSIPGLGATMIAPPIANQTRE